jgi:hypothetical protein
MILFPPLISLIILLIIFGGALVGMLIARRLPEQHLSSETKAVITTSMAVVGTMSALVISLLISSANTSFSARNAEVAQLSTDIIRMNSLLVRYGPAADPARQALQQYAAMTYHDLFARREGRKTTVENASTDKVLEQIQDRILNLKSGDSRQQWLASQALQGEFLSIAIPRRGHPLANRPIRELRSVRTQKCHSARRHISLRIRGRGGGQADP